MSTTTNLDTLVINYLSQLQYDEAVQEGTLNENQLYLTPAQVLTLATVARSGSYNDLSDKPTIPTVPTNVSDFTNDVGYITDYTETDPLFTSAFVGGGGSNGFIADANAADKYIGIANGWSASRQNYPSEFSNKFGILITKNRYSGTSTDLIVQTLISYTGEIWGRKCESGTWSSWIKNITYSTTDLTAGSSALTTGQVYLVYE